MIHSKFENWNDDMCKIGMSYFGGQSRKMCTYIDHVLYIAL